MEIMKKFESLNNAEELQRALENVSTEEELLVTLKQHGVELNLDELQELAEKINPEGELNEEDLDMVAGGNPAIILLVIAAVYTYYKIKQIQSRR